MPPVCRINFISCPSVASVLDAGSHHPVFGALIDLGTTCVLKRSLSIASLKGSIIRCLETRCERDRAFIEDRKVEEREDVGAIRRFLEGIAREGRLLAILWERDWAHDPFMIAAGIGLPNMGFVGDCSEMRFERTVGFLLGDASAAEGSVFSEPPSDAEAEEEALMQRLTKLYGD